MLLNAALYTMHQCTNQPCRYKSINTSTNVDINSVCWKHLIILAQRRIYLSPFLSTVGLYSRILSPPPLALFLSFFFSRSQKETLCLAFFLTLSRSFFSCSCCPLSLFALRTITIQLIQLKSTHEKILFCFILSSPKSLILWCCRKSPFPVLSIYLDKIDGNLKNISFSLTSIKNLKAPPRNLIDSNVEVFNEFSIWLVNNVFVYWIFFRFMRFIEMTFEFE